MLRRLLPTLLLVLLPNALWPCTMTIPAYGVYSGGTLVLFDDMTDGKALGVFIFFLMGIVCLKSLIFAQHFPKQKERYFGYMIWGNILSTIMGLLLEFIHFTSYSFISLIFLPFVFFPSSMVIHLKRFDFAQALKTPKLGRIAFTTLVLAFATFVTTIIGFMPLTSWPDQPFYWISKTVFAYGALIIALIVTTTYEYGVIQALDKSPTHDTLKPAIRANLIIFLLIFASMSVVLWMDGNLPRMRY